MTAALVGYSAVFMRYAMAVTPKNYLLFGCHVVNFSAQCTQGFRYVKYWNLGGREEQVKAMAEQGVKTVELKTQEVASKATAGAKEVTGEVKKRLER